MSKRWVDGVHGECLCERRARHSRIQIPHGITAGACVTTGDVWRMRSIAEIDFANLIRRQYTPSPDCWADQILYFLMLDRFSDGNERGGFRNDHGQLVTTGMTPLATSDDIGSVPYSQWLSESAGWQGGTLKGLRSKLGYLRRLGVTAVWISPVFKQVPFE